MKTFILNRIIPMLCGFAIGWALFAMIGYGAFVQGQAYVAKNDIGNYALTTVVVAVNRSDDIVIVEDGNGNLWQFCGSEDWEIGDCASLIMSDCGTAEIYDDEIISARYSNFTAD